MPKVSLEMLSAIREQARTFEYLQKAAESEGALKTASLLGDLALSYRVMEEVFRMRRFAKAREHSVEDLLGVLSKVFSKPSMTDDIELYATHTPTQEKEEG